MRLMTMRKSCARIYSIRDESDDFAKPLNESKLTIDINDPEENGEIFAYRIRGDFTKTGIRKLSNIFSCGEIMTIRNRSDFSNGLIKDSTVVKRIDKQGKMYGWKN